MMFQCGDIIEPRDGRTPLPCGLYQVTGIEDGAARLSRLHSNEDGKLALTNRISELPIVLLEMFRCVRLTSEERV